MDNLNYFIADQKIDFAMAKELRALFLKSRSLQRINSYKHLYDRMSPMLRGRVALHCTAGLIEKVYYFEGCEVGFLALMSQKLTSVVFPPQEVVDQVDTIHMLTKGVAAKAGRVLGVNSVWGEDLILDSWELMDSTAAMALTYIEVSRLHKDDIVDAMVWFPEIQAKVRKAAVRMAVRRGVVQYARKLTMQRQGASRAEIRRQCSWMAKPAFTTTQSREGRLRQVQQEEEFEKHLMEQSSAYKDAGELGPAMLAKEIDEHAPGHTFKSMAHGNSAASGGASSSLHDVHLASASAHEFHLVKTKVCDRLSRECPIAAVLTNRPLFLSFALAHRRRFHHPCPQLAKMEAKLDLLCQAMDVGPQTTGNEKLEKAKAGGTGPPLSAEAMPHHEAGGVVAVGSPVPGDAAVV